MRYQTTEYFDSRRLHHYLYYCQCFAGNKTIVQRSYIHFLKEAGAFLRPFTPFLDNFRMTEEADAPPKHKKDSWSPAEILRGQAAMHFSQYPSGFPS